METLPFTTVPGGNGADARAVVVSVPFSKANEADRTGTEHYSYYYVYRAFAPLLQRWGTTHEVTQPESRLDYALRRVRQGGQEPVHLSFLPLHHAYLTTEAPNVAFPFWEFPDIPQESFQFSSRHHWGRIAGRFDLLLTASMCTREAFIRAGVRTPIHVVPVPIRAEYFAVPDWQPGQQVAIDCPYKQLPPTQPPSPREFDPWLPVGPTESSWWASARLAYKVHGLRWLPRALDRWLTRTARAVLPEHMIGRGQTAWQPPVPPLTLSGIVYTTILNPHDKRKNWRDMLAVFLHALGDRDDATLVIKMVTDPALTANDLQTILTHYQNQGVSHRCKLVIIPAYLSNAQMLDLARATTWYVNTSTAEGACLPLQDFLAAGRPGIAPVHTAMADYFHDGLGLVVGSTSELTCWPHDPSQRCSTSWQPVDRPSLCEQYRKSYQVARHEPQRYQALAARGRREMAAFAGTEQVWSRLAAALNQLQLPGARPSVGPRRAA